MKHQHLKTTPEVSRRMANVHLKRGEAECILAKRLWAFGYRYRLNYKKLPGSPDIALIKYKIAIFVDGEFWHGYNWEIKKSRLKRNREYWIEKIEENIARDTRVDKELLKMEWIPVHFWSEEVIKNTDDCVKVITELIFDVKMQSYDCFAEDI